MPGKSRQRGAFLVLAAILMAALLGVVALGIDVGRLYALRSEMQNAADAAALAAAAELDGTPDARARAIAAAQDMLQHDSRFASTAALLGEGGLPTDSFQFYCLIGAKYDPPFSATYCSDVPDGEGRYFATSDAEAHYVRVVLDPVAAADRFRLQLLFLPVLSAVGVQTQDVVSVRAQSLGGRNFYTCDVPPMAICDPFEGTGTTFREAMSRGDGIELRGSGSGQWTNGNFGFVTPPDGSSGASALANLIANENGVGCSAPYIQTEPGAMAGPTTNAFNTRFDQYSGSFNNKWSQYPPAPNVVDYPHDATKRAIDDRFGNGDWDFASYWNGAHPGVTPPNGWSNLNRPARWDVYNHEVDNGLVPNLPPTYAGQPAAGHVTAGTVKNRRLITIAVVSCTAMDLGGRSEGAVRDPDGYAKIFLYRQAEGSHNLRAWGEFVEWEEAGGDKFHVDVQLYE
ncbi:MAG: putative Flp pilus-assembly TadE/G-like [Moraxellaceae bacterium]|jgi:hypothetical protein|nr:putative Flp pilus-assembly TadE/G-like [Moraxellaceae bacterium]